ncbi:MAG: apolipoprotein N-acyltransferase [Microbacteriaceae bacterium]|nr:apolipoprotein N-acyltransferase [Microbacteriaceae bacterium]
MAPLPLPLALCAAIAGALLLRAAFPDHGLWPLAPVGVALVLAGMRGRRARGGFGLGFVAGLVFTLVHVQWTSEFLGPLPWAALSTLMALWWAAGGALMALAWRRLGPGPGLVPLAIAGLWTLREGIASTWPYGGFAWGRVAQSQSDSPWVELVSWVGPAGLGFALVWLAALALELAHDRRRSALRRASIVLAAALVLALVPQWRTPTTGTTTVLAVQGDTPGASYFIPSEPGEILLAHAAATALPPTVAAGTDPDAPIDLVLWPEGSVDVSPAWSAQAAAVLDDVAAAAGAPVLANTVHVEGEWGAEGTEYFNTQFVWTPGPGWGDQYDKAHPIPFGEYVPDREFYERLAPDLIGLIQREYTPGTRPNALGLGGTGYGVFICYDIVDDALVRQAIAGGAEVLLAPTNNADFGRTDESGQQLATARLRAVETSRAVVQASTVGWSAAYGPDGAELAAIDWYEPGAILVTVPTSTGSTPAVAAGRAIEVGLAGLGLALCLVGARGRGAALGARTTTAPAADGLHGAAEGR